MKKINIGNLKTKYYNEEKIDLKARLSQKDLEILTKLGINIENKKYTEYEYDLLKDKFLKYDEDQNCIKDIGISINEYDKVWDNLYRVLAEVS